MQVSAESFSIVSRLGSEGRSMTAATTQRIFSPLKNTVMLLESGGRRLCIVTSHFMTHYYPFSNTLRQAVAEAVGLPFEQVLSFSSHNHCCVKLETRPRDWGKSEREVWIKREELTAEGIELIDQAAAVARRLPQRLEEVVLRFGVGHERRISHNRKGHRADGSTYMMREEDRLLLGDDFCGDIDDDAAVLGFFGRDGRARLLLGHFTGHPVTAFDPERPVVFGEYPQVACDLLSEAFGGAPTAFLQGCAGDVNAKGLLSGKPVEQSVADATYYGRCLAQTWIDAMLNARTSQSDALTWSVEPVSLPFTGVPSLAALDAQIADMHAFIARCERNDPDTRGCQGLNFPSRMSPHYRGALVQPLLRWANWARAFHTEARLHEAPQAVDVETHAIRLGDVGLVGLNCEPFDSIGRQIKRDSPMALTLPCAYMHETFPGYVPDAGNLGDTEYMSGFYRYTTSLLPYAPPAGDALAQAGTQMLHKLWSAAR